MTQSAAGSPLIVHVVHRFDYGGLENGLANLINGLERTEWRHAVIALTQASEFASRIRSSNVVVYECRKKPGNDLGAYRRVIRLLRQLRPDILHTRNLGTLEVLGLAALAGVPIRIHGEHGWDDFDHGGMRKRHQLLRRGMCRFAHAVVAVSIEIERWLIDVVRVPAERVVRICNGVDTKRFHPSTGDNKRAVLPGLAAEYSIVIGSVTRFESIKDPLNLVKAFVELHRLCSARALQPALVILGDGPLRGEAMQLLENVDLLRHAWLPGNREDVADILRGLDVFVLGSRREGVSNTILEAMATGLPVVATDTGGNLELVRPGVTGELVPVGDPERLAKTILGYAYDRALGRKHGLEGRRCVEERFSISSMISGYQTLYRHLFNNLQTRP